MVVIGTKQQKTVKNGELIVSIYIEALNMF